ncbi:MAG TPA: hypothetical protein VFV33_12740, partial [Gemmatimonadaceae bacterium]|nr:hypothetical protein [Gemmatimonadaceae bacterium]
NLAERYWRFERWLREMEARVHSPVGVTGAVYAMKRECWHPLPPGLILDDLYAPMHLVLRGYRVGFDREALAFDDRRFPSAQEFRRKVRTLTGVLQLCAWLPDVLVPWRNPIWMQFLFHKLLRLASPYLLLAIAVSLAAWLVGALRSATSPAVVAMGIAVLALPAVLVFAVPRVRQGLVMAAAMQAAIVRATVNGARGRWNVWSR